MIRGSLEFIHYFDHYPLKANDDTQIFPVPYIDIPSCYLTKLLANADRNSGNEKKDIFDLIMMHEYWGPIPQSAWQAADDQYGLKVVMNGLHSALKDLSRSPERYIELAVTGYSIEPALAQKIVTKFSKTFLNSILEQ